MAVRCGLNTTNLPRAGNPLLLSLLNSEPHTERNSTMADDKKQKTKKHKMTVTGDEIEKTVKRLQELMQTPLPGLVITSMNVNYLDKSGENTTPGDAVKKGLTAELEYEIEEKDEKEEKQADQYTASAETVKKDRKEVNKDQDAGTDPK